MSLPTSPPEDRAIVTTMIEWRGITIEISYEPDWLGTERDPPTAHLQITAIRPERTALPMTDTGYRSHFTSPEFVAEKGGPEAFVLFWLELDARDEHWKKIEERQRQLSLF